MRLSITGIKIFCNSSDRTLIVLETFSVLMFMKDFKSVILPIIIEINTKGRVLIHWDMYTFSVGNLTMLINLKGAEDRNNELFLFSQLFSLSHPSK